MDIAQFRIDFPEFTDATTYPTAMIKFWSRLAEVRMNVLRWGNLYPYGVELCTAHYITVASKNATSPGGVGGMVASKSVGPAAVSYDTASISIDGAGDWNATSYGRQWKQLANIVGMGGIQLSGNEYD